MEIERRIYKEAGRNERPGERNLKKGGKKKINGEAAGQCVSVFKE